MIFIAAGIANLIPIQISCICMASDDGNVPTAYVSYTGFYLKRRRYEKKWKESRIRMENIEKGREVFTHTQKKKEK